ncbi:hypothetical protein PCASD_02180 [Puccinia coronata f. sp. avenae]|uniref:C2H2-type domain-containing protein n=1 Tax=Puccinia coronata f. sp. avenae TaxID=200324 RepID=A0A2N5VI54_9BASI|nr:hypothetical protein PCASD_02180 [Puccinia coronata f. sp. avenae]
MAHPNPLPVAERNSSPAYPETWVEPSSLSYDSAAITMPTVEDVSSFDHKSYCAGLDAPYGPGGILLPLLEDTNIYPVPMALAQDPAYQVLESTMFKNGEMNDPYQPRNEPSHNFLFSTSGGYESSLSPSSSRPCTAGEGFSFYSNLSQTGAELRASPKSAVETNHNDFSLHYMPPYIIQHSTGPLAPREEIGVADTKFPATTNTAQSTMPTDLPERYSWSAALSHAPRPWMEGPFAQSEVFTTRCIQPITLLGYQAGSGKPKESTFESGHAANGKASFLPGNWESQGIFSNENIKHTPQPIKKGLTGKKRPRRKNPATESLPRTDSIGVKLPNTIVSPPRACDYSVESIDPPKQPTEASGNKARVGKFVCPRISKVTQEVCGRKFQRSEHLKRHEATHDELKPHQCPICERFFGRTDNLTQHVKTHENAHGRNTKLLKAKLAQQAEQGKGFQKIDRKPTDYASRSSRRKKAQQT